MGNADRLFLHLIHIDEFPADRLMPVGLCFILMMAEVFAYNFTWLFDKSGMKIIDR